MLATRGDPLKSITTTQAQLESMVQKRVLVLALCAVITFFLILGLSSRPSSVAQWDDDDTSLMYLSTPPTSPAPLGSAAIGLVWTPSADPSAGPSSLTAPPSSASIDTLLQQQLYLQQQQQQQQQLAQATGAPSSPDQPTTDVDPATLASSSSSSSSSSGPDPTLPDSLTNDRARFDNSAVLQRIAGEISKQAVAAAANAEKRRKERTSTWALRTWINKVAGRKVDAPPPAVPIATPPLPLESLGVFAPKKLPPEAVAAALASLAQAAPSHHHVPLQQPQPAIPPVPVPPASVSGHPGSPPAPSFVPSLTGGPILLNPTTAAPPLRVGVGG